MNLIQVTFAAGEQKNFAGVGRYFRILNGTGDFKVDAHYKSGSSTSSGILAGVGVDLSHPESGEPFINLVVTASDAQTVKMLVSIFPSSDSRLTGDIDINGVLSVVQAGGSSRAAGVVAVSASTATLLRAQNLNRLKCAFHFPAACFLGMDNTVNASNGFPMDAGQKWIDENTSEIWIFCTSAISVPYFEDVK